jgi:adenylate cyclase
MKRYDDAIVWLRKSVEVMPNMWYNRAYLLSTYALTGRHEQPGARNAVSDYNSVFSGHTVQHITEMYEKEFPHPDPGMQASIQELYTGLRLAGVPER